MTFVGNIRAYNVDEIGHCTAVLIDFQGYLFMRSSETDCYHKVYYFKLNLKGLWLTMKVWEFGIASALI